MSFPFRLLGFHRKPEVRVCASFGSRVNSLVWWYVCWVNAKELKFAEHYVSDPNAAASARAAGYSESFANHMASSVLQRPHVQEHIAYLRKKIEKAIVADAATVIDELVKVAFASPVDFLKFEEDRWTGKKPDELTAEQRSAVCEIHVRDVYEGKGENRRLVRQEFKYKLVDKMAALTGLGKHTGVFEEGARQGLPLDRFKDIPHEKLLELGNAMGEVFDAEYEEVTANGSGLSDD